MEIPNTAVPLPARPIDRKAERRAERHQRQGELIKTCRRLVVLAEQEAWDTGPLAERCRLLRLIESADAVLRRSLNPPAKAANK